MLQTIDEAKIIITKFRDNLFIKEIMEEAKKNEKNTQEDSQKIASQNEEQK
jgi:hypothetical protein